MTVSPERRSPDAGGGSRPRIQTLDVLRGVAIIGTLGTNIWGLARLESAIEILFAPKAWWASLDEALVAVTLYLTNGKFLGLLAILFGVGLELQRRSAEQRGAPWLGRYAWRNVILLLIGFGHFTLVYEYDILMGYAVAAIVVAWLARGRRRLVVGLVVAAVLHVVLYGGLATLMQPDGSFGPDDATTSTELEQVDAAATQVALEGSYADGVAFRLDHLGAYRFEVVTVLPLNIVLFGIGVLLMRWGIFDGTEAARHRARRLLLVGVLVGATLNLVAFAPDGRLLWLGRYLFAPFMSLGYLAIVVLLGSRAAQGVVGRAVAAMGRAALTCYVLQNLLASAVFLGWGLGLKGQFGAPAILLVWAGISVLLAVGARAWLSRFARGPIEGPWRWAAERPFAFRPARSLR